MKKLFSILVFLLFVYPNTAISEKQIVEIPFLFAEDEELETIETYDDILHDKSQAILKDEYLSEPLTKLDFVLIKMNEEVEEQIDYMKIYLDGGYDKDFETIVRPGERPSSIFPRLSGSVRFKQKQGKIIISTFLEGAGKPRKPLNKICKDLMGYYTMRFPQDLKWNYVYQYFIGELHRGEDYDRTKPSSDKIANNIVWEIKISSIVYTEDFKSYNYYILQCIKDDPSPDADLKYIKFSVKNLPG